MVAAIEALKGLLVLAVGFGLTALVHRDVHHIAEELVRHFHLNPASRYPGIFIDTASRLTDPRLWLLAAFAFLYASLRLIEAYGLWQGFTWAEWFGAITGGIYIPIEIYELAQGLSWAKLALLSVNIWIVAYLVYLLWVRPKPHLSMDTHT
jgi:uncharacterized membrane protein (DUF2068 family)